MKIGNIIKSDLYKYLHSPVLLIHVAAPLLGMGIFVWYYSFSAMDEKDKVLLYMQVLSCTYPLLIGMVTAMISEMEQMAGKCQLMQTIPGNKCIAHVGKWVVLLLFGLAAVGMASLGFGFIFRLEGGLCLSLPVYGMAAVVTWFSAWPLYFLSYLVSFLWGKSYSIGLGVTGSLLTALMLTGIGDGSWYVQPWGIMARFNTIFISSAIDHSSIWAYNSVYKAMFCLTLFSLVWICVMSICFSRWEGRKRDE